MEGEVAIQPEAVAFRNFLERRYHLGEMKTELNIVLLSFHVYVIIKLFLYSGIVDYFYPV